MASSGLGRDLQRGPQPHAHKTRQELQLRTLGVFARGFVGEGLIERDPVQLTLDLLVKRADSDVADTVSHHSILKYVRITSVTLHRNCQKCENCLFFVEERRARPALG
jgi:hypothetical protein